MLAIASLAVAACSASAAPSWTFSPEAAPPAGASSAPEPTTAPPATGDVLGTLEITSVDLGFEPTELSVAEPGRYEVKLANRGEIPHDVTFADGTKTATANGGETVSAVVDVPDGGLTFICSVPGHSDAGMKGAITALTITAAPLPPPTSSPIRARRPTRCTRRRRRRGSRARSTTSTSSSRRGR
jgi:uncharacterized cupredoxin-like copper-binding protein